MMMRIAASSPQVETLHPNFFTLQNIPSTPGFWRLAAMAGCLLASFFFSACEFAVIRLDRLALKEEAESGSRSARLLSSFLSDTGRFLSSLSVGNTVANLLLSSLVAISFAPSIAHIVEKVVPGAQNPASFEAPGAALLTLVLSYVVLVFGEIAPKQFALARGDAFARKAAPTLRLWAALISPAVFLVSGGAKLLLKAVGVKAPMVDATPVSEEQIMRQVEWGEEHGSIETDEKEMIENVFELKDLTAEDVMVHRKDVVALPTDVTWSEVRDAIRRNGVSRIPIYRGSIDTIEGILNSRDFLLRSTDSKNFSITPLLRKAMFVPETVKADILLKRMQKRKQSMAIVIDDHGGTSGIVTIEDLVEQVVGELYDEYDKDEDVIRIEKIGEGRWRIPGEAELDDVSETVGEELAEGEYTTLGGWLFERLASIPAQGAVVDVPELGLKMKVEKMDGHRIDSVLVVRSGASTPSEPAQSNN